MSIWITFFYLFKSMMGREEIAKDFFHNHLPKGLVKLMDVDSLEIRKEIIEEAISEETGGVVMTVAEQLIKKGIAEGIAEGRAEGIAEGRAEGLIKGELIGDIRMAQLKKGMPVSAKEELERLSTVELQRRLKDLS